MTRTALIAGAFFALAGCTPGSGGDAPGRSDTRQMPTQAEPGLHVGGYFNVGVVKSF